MPPFFKKRKKKESKGGNSSLSQQATPSTSTLISVEHSDAAIERIDWALQIADILKDISEGSQLLAPLKTTCALIARGLEITRVSLILFMVFV